MMTEEQMKERLYELYQLKWMMTHGYGLKEMLMKLTVHAINLEHSEQVGDMPLYNGKTVFINNLAEHWAKNNGFNGEIWNSYNEFCRAEMSDVGYIKNLLDIVPSEEGLRDAYNKWLKDNGSEAAV